MKHLKSLSLAALAALAVLAVVGAGAASASHPKAEPTSPNTFPVPFTGHGGFGELEATDGHQLDCTTSTSKGEISSATTAQNISITFHGCRAFFGLVSCTGTGQPIGTVVTNALHGTLVYLETGSAKKGLLLKPLAGTVLAVMNCGGTTITVTGQVLAELVQKTHTEYTLHFRMLSNTHPSPASYLNPTGCGHTSTTESLKSAGTGGFTPFATSPSGLEGTHTIKLSKGTALGGTGCV
jgi:hypothetical protein